MSQPEIARLDALLMRALDGEASAAERDELLALADAEPRLAELRDLRGRLRVALLENAGPPVDVVADVMAALTLDDGWDATSAALREALTAEPALPVVDAVMAAVLPEPEPDPDALLSALHDGELSREQRLALVQRLSADRGAHRTMNRYAELGRMVREAINTEARPAEFESLWPVIAHDLGMEDPEHVPGWDPIARELRAAVAATAAMSAEEDVALTAAIMNSLPRPEPRPIDEPDAEPEPVPLWRLLLGNPTLIVAAVAALLIGVYSADPNRLGGVEQTPTEVETPVATVTDPPAPDPELEILENNGAAVESLEYADEVIVQVVQLEDGAPIFLMIDEGEV
ncbi:MAG: hypothetical protein H6739_36360 [Alphaproteobacteria bacterium]|nr:hypothetical protein [Alphaproteobacteria bacterium]